MVSLRTSFKPNDEQENKDYREEALPIPQYLIDL